MPAHLKSSLIGAELTIPITHGHGTWVPGRVFIYVNFVITAGVEILLLLLLGRIDCEQVSCAQTNIICNG